jgi:hypothetical protein
MELNILNCLLLLQKLNQKMKEVHKVAWKVNEKMETPEGKRRFGRQKQGVKLAAQNFLPRYGWK